MNPRSALVTPLVLLAAASIFAACGPRLRTDAPQGSKQVKIKARCSETGLDVSIKPFAIPLDSGQSVFWEPESGKNDVAVSIVPKDSANWPFGAPPPTMPADDGAWSGELTSAAPNTVQYNLRFQCISNGVVRTITVDPDIIISGGSAQ